MPPACYEPDASDTPLAALPRVSVRTFASRLEGALRLDAPHAFQLTAELFGARDWLTLAGPKPFLPIAEPLYRYRTVLSLVRNMRGLSLAKLPVARTRNSRPRRSYARRFSRRTSPRTSLSTNSACCALGQSAPHCILSTANTISLNGRHARRCGPSMMTFQANVGALWLRGAGRICFTSASGQCCTPHLCTRVRVTRPSWSANVSLCATGNTLWNTSVCLRSGYRDTRSPNTGLLYASSVETAGTTVTEPGFAGKVARLAISLEPAGTHPRCAHCLAAVKSAHARKRSGRG